MYNHYKIYNILKFLEIFKSCNNSLRPFFLFFLGKIGEAIQRFVYRQACHSKHTAIINYCLLNLMNTYPKKALD